MYREYSFKRSFYYDAEKAIQRNVITFILGTRKCGKTVCMHQLRKTFSNSVYVDMKTDFEDDDQRRNFIRQVIKDISNNVNIIYLVDEATYMPLPDKDIAKIARTFSEYDNDCTKIIFSGSQSNALEFWGHIACGGNAAFIRTGFLSYPEWLAYKNTTEVSERTYLDYILNIRDFYDCFESTKEYLQGCLDETVISNRKAVEYIDGNSIEGLDVEMLLDVLYASLIKLHNRTSYEGFANIDLFASMIGHYFPKEFSEIKRDEKLKSISELLKGRYKKFKSLTSYDCKMAMQFLSNCGLITLTYISNELSVDPYISKKITNDYNELYLKPMIFQKFNFTINYPMFYIDLVNEVLKDKITDNLPRDLLGSIVECHIRGLLSINGAFEYHSNDFKEIDYVSVEGKAIEFSVSNKRMRDVNLQILPDEYEKILLTKDETDTVNDIKRIPYYKFIYDNSIGKELVENINTQKTNLFS